MAVLVCKPRETIFWWISLPCLTDLEPMHALKRDNSFVVSIQLLIVIRKDSKNGNETA